MTTTRQATGTTAGAETMDNYGTSGWTGWIVFAGVMMLMMGAFHVIQGLVALFQDTYYLSARKDWWCRSTTRPGAGCTRSWVPW